MITAEETSVKQAKIAHDTLERYSGSPTTEFCSYLLLTNFPRYVDFFATSNDVPIIEGSMFKVAHAPKLDVSILDFKIGSPAAALVVDLCAFLPLKSSLLLGMCGGLRRHYKIGDYLVPVAAIRNEGTSDFYFPPEVPAMANFLIQRAVSHALEEQEKTYHIGITHTMNKRFWEFNEPFKERIKISRAQGIEMECATLFMASYKYKLPMGALLLISDLPLEKDGVKTKESSANVYRQHTEEHVNLGISSLYRAADLIKHSAKGASRGKEHKW